MAVVNTESEKPARRRGRYPKDFRRDAATLVIDQHRSVADVAKELGVVEQTLGNWVRQARIDRGDTEGTTTDMRAENARLTRENKQLRLERDLLKKATAFWVNVPSGDQIPLDCCPVSGRRKVSQCDCAAR
jgi:transposase